MCSFLFVQEYMHMDITFWWGQKRTLALTEVSVTDVYESSNMWNKNQSLVAGITYQYPVSISLMAHLEWTDLCSWLLKKIEPRQFKYILGKLKHYHLNN